MSLCFTNDYRGRFLAGYIESATGHPAPDPTRLTYEQYRDMEQICDMFLADAPDELAAIDPAQAGADFWQIRRSGYPLFSVRPETGNAGPLIDRWAQSFAGRG